MTKFLAMLWLALVPLTFSGCEFIGDVFKSGILIGVIIIIAIVAVISFVIRLFTK